MIKHLPIILFLFCFTKSYCQDSTIGTRKYDYDDTTIINVLLIENLVTNKILVIDYLPRVRIFLSQDSVRRIALNNLNNDFIKNDNQNIIKALTQKSDTLFLRSAMPFLNHIISEQIKNGDVRVFEKKTQSFVSSIGHRLVRTISVADRKFYLSDRTLFFSVQEFSGIIPNEFMEIE